VDGVPQTDSRNSARVVNLPINDASSIEVVRGPNSALYGRTAIGGSVNVRTADPTPFQQVRFDLTGGQFGTLKGTASASGPIAQWGGYYVSLGSERNTGYYEKDTDFGVEEIAAFAKLTFVPDTRSFGSVSVQRVLSDNSTPTTVPIVEGRFLHEIDPAFDRLTNLNVPGTNYHQGEGRVTLNYTRQLAPWASLTEVFGYRAIQYKFIDDGDVIGAPFDLAAQTFTMYPFEQETNEDIFYQELRASLTPRSGTVASTLIVGGSYEHTSGFSSGNLIFTDADTLGWPINYVNPVIPPKSQWQYERFGGRDYNVGNLGLFVQYMAEPAARWTVTAGGRYDRIAIDSTQTFAAGRPRLEDTFQAFSPKLSATFRAFGAESMGPALNVYTTYSEAFLPPRRPNDLSGTTIDIDLEPEDIRNYEAGLKGSLLEGRLSIEASVFRMQREGIVTTVRQGPRFLPTNAGEHAYKGVETGASYAFSTVVSAYANASFYRNRFGEFVARDTVLTGNRLPISPDRVVNWGLTATPTAAVTATLDVKHVGDVFVDQINSFRFEPYTLVDAAVSWRRGAVRFTLSAHNLFDTEYYWNGDTSLGESADPGRPRQVLLTTSLLFR
jgi:iron complex outermembrane receptor protein